MLQANHQHTLLLKKKPTTCEKRIKIKQNLQRQKSQKSQKTAKINKILNNNYRFIRERSPPINSKTNNQEKGPRHNKPIDGKKGKAAFILGDS